MRTRQGSHSTVLLLALASLAACGGREVLGGGEAGAGGGQGGSTGSGGTGSGKGGAPGYGGYGGYAGYGGYGGYGTTGAGGYAGDASGGGGSTGAGGYAGSVGVGGSTGTGGSAGCGPVCAIYCQWGNVPDMRGCPTCACNPPPPCGSQECPPPPPFPRLVCPDGSTVGYACQRAADGTCSWMAQSCPNACPPVCDIACPYGNKVDSNGCTLCACNDPPACSTYDNPMTCDADMRCAWLVPGCGQPALAAQGCYSRADTNCSSDAGCSNGRTCLKRVVNPCATPTSSGATCAACGLTMTICL